MNKKILVVDNHPVILRYMANLLGKEGHQVKTAGDGLSALDILIAYIPDIIFIDLVMPNINGEQLCRIIQKMPALKDTYAVILSATIAEKSLNFRQLGADAFIVKGPFNQMAKHVLAVIEQSDHHVSTATPEKIMGSKGVYKREITKELISAKGHLETILENISDGIVELTSEGKIVFANAAAVSLMGFSEEVLLGSKFSDLINEGDRKRVEDSLMGMDKGSRKVAFDTPLFINDRHVTLNMAPIEMNGNSSVMVILNDITEVLQAEEILKKEHQALERQQLTQIIDLLPDATVVIDLEGKVIAWNRAIERMTGVKAREILGKGDYEYAIPFYGERRPVLIDLVGQWNKEIEGQYQYVKKIGTSLISETYDPMIKPGGFLWNKASLLYDSAGEIMGAIESIRDITEQKRLEAQLQQAQKMEAIGTLAGGIAHDFNNLLMAIQGHASIALAHKDSSHGDFEHLKEIEVHVESAVDLTRQLLGFARGGKYEVKPTDLNALIKKQNRMFGRTKKEIIVKGTYEQNLRAVDVDRGQIEQVLLNLYVNAWQAMPGGGRLYLKTENVILGEDHVKPFVIESGEYVKISVRDTGVGMDKAIRERIFDPFFTTKEMGRGTGLGLASAYGIIKNHGGFIDVYSEKGHGTIIDVYLPASEKDIVEAKRPVGDTLKGSETILFVDDEDMIIEVGEELLQCLGYKTLIAASGKVAVEIYETQKERIDMVILDMIMPDMNGGEVYDRMKEINPNVKVLLSSGYTIDGGAREVVDRGCNGFIQKPFKMKELSQKLREILEEKGGDDLKTER
ncbi:MAG: response regulator [Deltaproteobacteria bacterium]|nr:response regulator [Deltaproteobacteria bacterium]